MDGGGGLRRSLKKRGIALRVAAADMSNGGGGVKKERLTRAKQQAIR